MKYEDYSLVNLNIFLFFISIIIVFIFGFIYKISIYNNYKIIYVSNNIYEVILSDKDLKLFYKNSSLYIDNKKYNYNIDRVNRHILKKNKINYNELFIKVDKKHKYKVNDIIDIALLNRKEKLIDIFKCLME